MNEIRYKFGDIDGTFLYIFARMTGLSRNGLTRHGGPLAAIIGTWRGAHKYLHHTYGPLGFLKFGDTANINIITAPSEFVITNKQMLALPLSFQRSHCTLIYLPFYRAQFALPEPWACCRWWLLPLCPSCLPSSQ